RESLARKLLEHRIRAIGRRIRCNSSHSFYPSTSLDVRPGLEPRVTSVTPSYAASCMLGLGTKLVNEASVARPTRHQAVQETRGISGPSWSAWVATWQGLPSLGRGLRTGVAGASVPGARPPTRTATAASTQLSAPRHLSHSFSGAPHSTVPERGETKHTSQALVTRSPESHQLASVSVHRPKSVIVPQGEFASAWQRYPPA